MIKLYCNSSKCTNGKIDSRFHGQNIPEGTLQKHEYVSSSLDKRDGWKVSGIKTQGGCRNSAADYRTVKCCNCGQINTYDFARD